MQALIIKIAAIGDTIMALPMVTALRRRHPDAEVTWLCSETTADLVRLIGEIEIITVCTSSEQLRQSTAVKKREMSHRVGIQATAC
jgi:heptosyltransferase I